MRAKAAVFHAPRVSPGRGRGWIARRACAFDPVESLNLLTRESVVKSALSEYHDFKQATSRFFLAAVLTSDTVLEVVRRELRRVSSDVKITVEELRSALSHEVLKREVIEGEKADQARKKVARAAKTALRLKKDRSEQAVASFEVSDDPGGASV
ncbi:MAG: hypothetical protein ABIP63_01005 [Thermoanaerobaculia bacterium]